MLSFRRMYELPKDDRPGCRETLVLTRALFAVLLPPIAAMIAVLALVSLAVVCYAIYPALALLPLGVIAAGFLLFARWEQGRFRGPRT
jgi:hypothetical protein